jgi:hypothetical protein
MRASGEQFEALCADLDAALRTLESAVSRDASLWARPVPGRWTAAQHAEHIALCLEATAGDLQAASARWGSGTLPGPPRRGLLEWLFVRIAVEGGRLPRGGRTGPRFQPTSTPERAVVFGRIAAAAARHREVGLALAPADRDRLWVANPFLARWHYGLPELVRMHAVHARHHAAIVAEIPPAG